MLLGACLLLLPLCSLAQTALLDVPASLECRYGVIGLRAEEYAPDTLQVGGVVPGGPAARAGLLPGDLLLAAPPHRLRSVEDLSRLVQSRAPGDTLALVTQRQGRTLVATCAVTDRRHLFSFMAAQSLPLPTIGSRPSGAAPPLASAVADLLSRHQALPALGRLTAALAAEDSAYGADCRLALNRRALLHPLEAWSTLTSLAAAGGEPDLALLLDGIATRLDLVLPAPDPAGTPAPGGLLAGALAPYFDALQLVDAALAPLAAPEIHTLRTGFLDLLQTIAAHPSPDLADSTQDAQLRLLLGLAKRVQLGPLLQAARALALLQTADHLKRLQRAARQPTLLAAPPPGVEGALLFARSTPQGWILVGGEGDNRYRGALAVVIDLGGDDTYEMDALPPVFAAIDFRGDDQYLGQVAAPVAGVALVLDLQGDDRYQSEWLGQGAAFCGVGMLVDRRGRDQYLAAEYAQGAAFFGAGLLLDQGGDDTYHAARHSQGFGGPRGFGLLRDVRGNDHYLADGQVPSSYGDAGVFEGWSQGVGCGVRGYAEGGIGLLLDQRGDDRYQGGDFAQGVGYFFGLGALVDRSGDDEFLGSRYAQGAAAHQAVGLLADLAGDDRYQSRVAAAQGSAWDAAIGVLVDVEGNDAYVAGDLSQGAAAMNGLGLLVDQRGRDTYQAASGQGGTGSLGYWGGRQAPNLGILTDWAGKDRYNLAGRGNGMELRAPEIGLFEDR